ncbi:Tol-Pal system beta propeller repeat protein TolB [Aestuariibius sp. 2305UL40-4]|uniref:Tol-Pal system beta propeller repeat protein TolB n=1 Tax=Aestuariibius violaceus TaxID=3234132 RepID=UPI00345E3603
MVRYLLVLLFMALAGTASAQGRTCPENTLCIDVNIGTIEPLPFALPTFQAETPDAQQVAADISRVISEDLTGTGLFRQIQQEAFISQVAAFSDPIRFPDWRAINAQALITGSVAVNGTQLVVKFRLYDVFTGEQLGEGQQLAGTTDGWRRMAHKVADQVYARVTGEQPYFDSRVVFVAETGPKDNRLKRLAIMDFDGANVQYLTDSSSIVLAPRFSPNGDRVLYTSYESGFPRINMIDVASVGRREIQTAPGEMAFSPRFSRDGQEVIYSLANGGNTDIYKTSLATGQSIRLTQAPSIETAPSLSPDGSQIVFESDRSGNQQIYIMSAGGGEPRRISSGSGRYGTPVWSPRGDLVAFTKQDQGRFFIGVMRTDGSEERLLTASPLDEGPTWSPNGRVIMFMRDPLGATGEPSLYSVDITGRNLKRIPTPGPASDPSWGPLQP